MKNIRNAIRLLIMLMILTKCTPEKYVYFYENQDETKGKVKEVPYTSNDFRVNLDIATDSIIKEKDEVQNIYINFSFNGQFQYYPPNLKFEIYCNDEKIEVSDTIYYNITTVIDDHVTCYNDTNTALNIPELIQKLKAEKNLATELNYFSVVSAFPKCYIGNTTNPEKIEIKVKMVSDSVSNVITKTFNLKKTEINDEEYHLPVRPFG